MKESQKAYNTAIADRDYWRTMANEYKRRLEEAEARFAGIWQEGYDASEIDGFGHDKGVTPNPYELRKE